jgi:hypothetical protein
MLDMYAHPVVDATMPETQACLCGGSEFDRVMIERPGPGEGSQRGCEGHAQAAKQKVARGGELLLVFGIGDCTAQPARVSVDGEPRRSRARISRRMKLWLTLGYWLTK